MKKLKVIKSLVTHTSLEEATPVMLDLAKHHKPSYVCLVNAHMSIEAYDDPNFEKVVNNATIAFPDGAPIAKMMELLYKVKQKRIAGMDLFPYLLKKSDENNLNVAFIGSTNEVLDRIKNKVNSQFKNITISALISPPFRQKWDVQAYINTFNKTQTHIVFVALGCPLQEKWMFENSAKINALLIGVGGAFPTYVGVIKRAPKWMQNIGLEWLYRLLKEPKRMARRYFYTNSKFIYLSIKQLVFRNE